MRSPSKSGCWPSQTLTGLIGLWVKHCPPVRVSFRRVLYGLFVACLGAACSPSTDSPVLKPGDEEPKCVLGSGPLPDFTHVLGCPADFEALSARPFIQNIPGSYAIKTIIDRADGDSLYFANAGKYGLHYIFVSTFLSGNGKPVVPPASEFNLTEYYTPDRRFVLGALMHYTRPGIFVWEMTPSDNAGAEMIAKAYRRIADACFCGKELYFRPTSLAMEAEARKLPPSVRVLPFALFSEAFAFQPFNSATGIGKLVFATADQLRNGQTASGDILVLDSVPDGFPMAAGIITEQQQSPLSPINALSKEHGIPNMRLREAFTDTALRALEGKWVKLTVDPFGYSVSEATSAEADAWREAQQPAAISLPELDTTVGELRDLAEMLVLDSLGPDTALRKAVSIYGGVAGNLAALPHMDTTTVKFEKAFGIPVRYYRQHMRENGLDDSVAEMLADPVFRSDAAERERRLGSLREAIMAAPIDSAFWESLNGKLDADFPGAGSFRFLSSATAEGLDGLIGAGLYESRTGSRSDPAESVRKALLGVWASVWDFRAFEERSLRRIDHAAIGMGVLVREERAGAEAEGIAITSNPFDPLGNEPGFYINVKAGEASASKTDPAAAMDEFISHFAITGQPTVMLARAGAPGPEGTVLTAAQVNALDQALWEIHLFFQPVYSKDRSDMYGMGVGFKLAGRAGDPPGAKPVILIESANLYRGWGRW